MLLGGKTDERIIVSDTHYDYKGTIIITTRDRHDR